MKMRERKYIKFRVDMYSDTKFKIIDRRPERDLIHYVWNRVVILAGKVNREGELYLSKNIPYTVETLAIEFNRDIDQVKLALDLLIELEMIEISEHKIYIVKNFVKHQNIKVKEKNISKNKEPNIRNEEIQANEELKDQIHKNESLESQDVINVEVPDRSKNYNVSNLEINNKDSDKIGVNVSSENISTLNDNIVMSIKTEEKKRANKKKEKDNLILITDEEKDDNPLILFSDGEIDAALGKGERVVALWSY